jgi:hypothetical protein
MRVLRSVVLTFFAVTAAAAQAQDPLLSDNRLTVHTLLREDIFAGWMSDAMNRFIKAEANIEILLKERPSERANLLAWKGGTILYRAVLAHEAGKPEEFARLYKDAQTAFSDAAKASTGNDGVLPIVGGSYGVFAERLPKEHRAGAWAAAYNSYAMLWKAQGAGIEQMPVHFKGEVLAGLAESAYRTGKKDEATQYLDRMLTVLANTPYETTAKQWKADPASAEKTTLMCKNCHNPGRLSSRLKAIGQ